MQSSMQTTKANLAVLDVFKALPVWKYQRRSKRIVTVWIKRERPAYYAKKNLNYRLNNQTSYLEDWTAERNWWLDEVAKMSDFQPVACYPAQYWVHLTLEIRNHNLLSFDKERDNQLIIVDLDFQPFPGKKQTVKL